LLKNTFSEEYLFNYNFVIQFIQRKHQLSFDPFSGILFKILRNCWHIWIHSSVAALWQVTLDRSFFYDCRLTKWVMNREWMYGWQTSWQNVTRWLCHTS